VEATLVILKLAAWLFVNVTVWDALVVPNAWLANVRLAGLTDAARIPVPLRLTVGLTLAVVVIVSVSVREPATVGSKKTETVQVAPAANVPPFGHVIVKE
jgi:hypothetical protein